MPLGESRRREEGRKAVKWWIKGMKTTKRCSKCENYLTATTNRSRNLIHVRSTPHSPMLEVRSRNPIQGPAMSFGDGGDQREAAAATEKMEIKIKRTGFNEKLQTRGPNAACKSFRRSRASSMGDSARPRASGGEFFYVPSFNDPRELLGLFQGARGQRSLSANGKNEMEKIKNLGEHYSCFSSALEGDVVKSAERCRESLLIFARTYVTVFSISSATTHLISKCVQIHD